MASGFATFSTGRSRGRRASIVELTRHATANSGIWRAFTRTKSVPDLGFGDPSSVGKIEGLDANTEDRQELPLLTISHPITHYPRDSTVELGALGISFPYSPSISLQASSPAESAASVLAWVDFFSHSDRDVALPDNGPSGTVGMTETVDGLATPLAGATSSMTLMDSDICSKENSPVGDEIAIKGEQNLRLIGDSVVLKYILDGMATLEESHSTLGFSEQSKTCAQSALEGNPAEVPVSEAGREGSAVSTAADNGGLLELRHRKDPMYEDLPSISLITATPRGPTEERHQYFPVPPTPSPPITLLPTPNNRDDPLGTKEALRQDSQRPATSVPTVQKITFIQAPKEVTCLDAMPNPSYRIVEVSKQAPSQNDSIRTSDIPNAQPGSRFGSILRKISVGFPSIFRSRRGVVRPDVELLVKANPVSLDPK